MRLLIAEDSATIADGLTEALRAAGYAVDCVPDGAAADAALSSQSFDLLILDLGLPKLGGLEVLKRLRARRSALPVLILTARDRLEDRVLRPGPGRGRLPHEALRPPGIGRARAGAHTPLRPRRAVDHRAR